MKLQTVLRTVTLITVVLTSTLVGYGGSAIRWGMASTPLPCHSYVKPNRDQIARLACDCGLSVLARARDQNGVLIVLR